MTAALSKKWSLETHMASRPVPMGNSLYKKDQAAKLGLASCLYWPYFSFF